MMTTTPCLFSHFTPYSEYFVNFSSSNKEFAEIKNYIHVKVLSSIATVLIASVDAIKGTILLIGAISVPRRTEEYSFYALCHFRALEFAPKIIFAQLKDEEIAYGHEPNVTSFVKSISCRFHSRIAAVVSLPFLLSARAVDAAIGIVATPLTFVLCDKVESVRMLARSCLTGITGGIGDVALTILRLRNPDIVS